MAERIRPFDADSNDLFACARLKEAKVNINVKFHAEPYTFTSLLPGASVHVQGPMTKLVEVRLIF